MKYTQKSLAYAFDALEPYIDTKTMEVHYGKHHVAYINNVNTLMEKYPDLLEKSVESLLANLSRTPFDEKDKQAFINNAGGAVNHSLYWDIMAPKKEIDEVLVDELKKEFGSIDEFKKTFTQVAISRFGSGWAWLVRNTENKLEIYSLPNQDSPTGKGHKPIIGLDVWEHAYYLKYQNRRAEYIEAWWNVLKLI
ncbi:superoxide dismutase [Patescibacteria group bacterium]|nr:superoxide dismutase [Patescibacteria group bacterium]